MPTINASIIPKTNTNYKSLPSVAISGSQWSIPVLPGELFSKSPSDVRPRTRRYEHMCTLYMSNSVTDIADAAIISAYTPDYIIGLTGISSAWQYSENSKYFLTDTGFPSGATYEKYEIFYVDYQKSAFLTNLAGNTAEAITGMTFGHTVISGGQTFTAKQIYYKFLGIVNYENF
jgi:hypothetical protein